MNNSFVFDMEGDGLYPTKIHCMSFYDIHKDKSFSTTDYDVMRKTLLEADYIIGHNIIVFDVLHCERILGIKIKAKPIDTLGISYYLHLKRPLHGLESWGEEFGIPKPEIDDWENLSVEEYIHRCEEDVKINTKLWNKFRSELLELYGDVEGVLRLIRYTNFKMRCLMLSTKSGWRVDEKRLKKVIEEYEDIKQEKVNALAKAMPKKEETTKKTKPKKPFKKDGTLSKIGEEWLTLTRENGLPFDTDEEIEVHKGWEEPNPGSTPQLKDWLFSLGWQPQTFKTSKRKDGVHEVEQINQDHGKGVCPSVLDLIELEPAIEHLAGLSILGHRIPQLKRIQSDLVKLKRGDRVEAFALGFTNTMRLKHAGLVNLPKMEKPYSAIRSVLICDDDKILCGSDMSSLEDRIKQHFIWPHDPDYVKSMMRDDFDPHLELAKFAGVLTQEDIRVYQESDDGNETKIKIGKIRSMYKNGNYACQYGAGVPRLMKTIGCDRETAKGVHEAYWGLNWAIKKVAENQKIKNIDGQMWLWNPIAKLWYHLKNYKDVFSTLVQGTAAYVFDLWLGLVLNKREQLTGQFHDEFIIEIKEGFEKQCSDLLRGAIDTTNNILKLNRELDIDIKFGKRYSEIH